MDILSSAIFYLISAVIIAGALGIVTSKKLVHSALLMVVCFIGVGCLYIYSDADFLGAAQLLIYSGAVGVLIVLGIMLTHHTGDEPTNPSHSTKLTGALIGGLFAVVMILVYLLTPLGSQPMPAMDTVTAIADLLLKKYVLGFEIAAVLLLAALIGAIILAKGGSEE